MRHVLGFVLGSLLAPAVVAVTGWSLPLLIEGHRGIHVLASTTGLMTVGVLAACALLVGVCLVAPRLSPLAPGLAGLALAAWSGLYVLAPQLATGALPNHPVLQGATELLALGLYLPLALVLCLPLLLPSRWRRADRRREEEDYLNDYYDEEDEGPHAAEAAPHDVDPREHPAGPPEPQRPPQRSRHSRRYAGRRRARG